MVRKQYPGTLVELFLVALQLGLTSFGGPVAHLGYFQHVYVTRYKWLDDQAFADLVALSNFLPGPASSQVGIGVGTLRAGPLGGFIAWLGFTLPSALLLYLFAFIVNRYDVTDAAWLHGLKIVAVVIVSQAILSMGKKLAGTLPTATMAVLSAMVLLLFPSPYTQIAVLLAAGLIGLFIFYKPIAASPEPIQPILSRGFARFNLLLFVLLFILSPLLAQILPGPLPDLFAKFFRSGSLVFGGGHVVLPLLEGQFVPSGMVTVDEFLAGYGAAQAIPGPLVTFSAYLGAVVAGTPGALVSLIAIFLPSFLLLYGVMPFWQELRVNPRARAMLTGVNASVVGLLISALYHPLWTSAILSAKDMALAICLFLFLVIWKRPPWMVVIAGALGAMFLAF